MQDDTTILHCSWRESGHIVMNDDMAGHCSEDATESIGFMLVITIICVTHPISSSTLLLFLLLLVRSLLFLRFIPPFHPSAFLSLSSY